MLVCTSCEVWLKIWLKRQRERHADFHLSQTLKSARWQVFLRSHMKSLWEGVEKGDWVSERLLSLPDRTVMSKNNALQINKPCHLKREVSDVYCTFDILSSAGFLLLSAWKASFSALLYYRQPATTCSYILHVLLFGWVHWMTEILPLSKQKDSEQLFLSFLSGTTLTPVLHQVWISLIPFPPPLIPTPATRNEWFTWKPPPIRKDHNQQYTTAKLLPLCLISLCCVTLEKPLRSSYFSLFFTLSLSHSELHTVLTVYAF